MLYKKIKNGRTALLSLGVILLLSGVARAAHLDEDGDGWFSGPENQRVTLRLVAIESGKAGRFFLNVGDLRLPLSNDKSGPMLAIEPNVKTSLDGTVASRAVGTWRFESKTKPAKLTWKTPVTLTRAGNVDSPSVSGSGTIEWTNQPKNQAITITLADGDAVRLEFRTTVDQFSDPSPSDRNGDHDRDGIFDHEEAVYARHGVGLGDPERQDLILVVGYTHADWKMTTLTRTLLHSKFCERDINLYLVATKEESLGLATPGLMQLGGKPFAREEAIGLKQARQMRKTAFPSKSPMRENAHLVVLAHQVLPKPNSTWGWADFPGNTLVIRSWLPVLGPDFHQYQAKDLMHELGHNLGLAHPEESDERCMSGPIPVEERTSSSTVMGTPKADRGNTMSILRNAWARPLDYSPTQWKNLRLDWVRK